MPLMLVAGLLLPAAYTWPVHAVWPSDAMFLSITPRPHCAGRTGSQVHSSTGRLCAIREQCFTVPVLPADPSLDYLLQGLMQRVQNYITAILIRQVVLRKAASTIQQFAKKTGQRVAGLDGGPNAAAAVIATVDFALEYPIALPPIVQVCASLFLPKCFLAPCHPSQPPSVHSWLMMCLTKSL